MSDYVGNFGNSHEEQMKRRLQNVPLPDYRQPEPGSREELPESEGGLID